MTFPLSSCAALRPGDRLTKPRETFLRTVIKVEYPYVTYTRRTPGLCDERTYKDYFSLIKRAYGDWTVTRPLCPKEAL